MKIELKDWIDNRKKEIRAEIEGDYALQPRLLILQMGDDAASNSYIKGKLKDAADCGIIASLFKTNDAEMLIRTIDAENYRYDGIILQEPCGLSDKDRAAVLGLIDDNADVDGFSKTSKHQPCTPKGIISIIDTFYPNVAIEGDVAVVVGKGELVGAPLVPMLMKKGFTVISCNSKTKNIAELTKKADILISAVGKEKLITRDMVKDGAFIIDAGITFDENGKLCGDCDKAMYDDEKIAITTVPGGVGLTTRLSLMENVLDARKNRIKMREDRIPF